MKRILLLLFLFVSVCGIRTISAQELNCKVVVNHSQIQGTNTSVFETLQNAISEFMNNRSWTELQFGKEERIDCTLNITIKQYKEAEGDFTGELLFQTSRPVFNSTYNSTVFSMRDPSFNFTYKEFDQLEFNENSMDNNLTAMLAYYAYLFIGMDLDTMSPLGGTDVLRTVENIVNNAQTMSEVGWKAFNDTKNRHAIINDYMESSMEPYRRLQYKYYREGLDEMANNVDRGRTAVTEAINMLKEAHSNKPLSMLPQIFTDFKRDELVSIYNGHGTAKEKEEVYNILSDLNASQNQEWTKIKK
ncbi:MAG: DUF4835 family protein [Bacteroides sp.]|nr:DUF4835 family protein [Roseburia sp.]MCM1347469.1 DUF4835 family protein [Bacteroides sp.]MCM1421322.1 DUF4835 family protein [Bacteroides sp.]